MGANPTALDGNNCRITWTIEKNWTWHDNSHKKWISFKFHRNSARISKRDLLYLCAGDLKIFIHTTSILIHNSGANISRVNLTSRYPNEQLI